jgi:hypothetical protein
MKKQNLATITLAALESLMCRSSANAQNLIVSGDFGTGDIPGWIVTKTTPVTITYAVGTRNPSGSAFLARNNSTAAPFTPTYSCTLDPAANVPSIVTGGAGPQIGQIEDCAVRIPT